MAGNFGSSYGYQMALKRRKKKEAANKSENVEKRGTSTQKRKAPSMTLYPMSSHDPSNAKNINWGVNDDVSDVVLGRLRKELLTILKLSTGVGKTALAVETVGKLQEQRGEYLRFIVIAPRQVVDKKGWHSTIQSWNNCHPDNQLEPIMIEAPDKFSNILDHATTLREVYKLLGDDGILVIDEVHNYKSPTSKRSKRLKRLRKYHKLGLSATPLTNDVITDSISYLVMSNRYNSKTAFERVSGLDMRKDMLGRYTVYDKDSSINGAAWPYYYQMLNEMSEIVYAPDIDMSDITMPSVTSRLIQVPHSDELTAKMRSLRQAFDMGAFDTPVDYTMAMIETIARDEERLNKLIEIITQSGVIQPLIFYWHNATLGALEDCLKKENIDYQIISGAHSASKVDLSSSKPILIQYQSGAEGIEMPDSNLSVFYQNQNSASKLDQAKGRNVRRGSSHHVTQYSMVCDHMFDNMVFERLMKRQETSMKVLIELALMSNE